MLPKTRLPPMDKEHIRNVVSAVVDEYLRASAENCRSVALGADHGGYKLKEALKHSLQKLGYQVRDVGTNSSESCDYPDFAKKVAESVLSGECERGVMIDGAGIGSSMVCNKFAGIRAALCYDMKTILNSRQHNDANVLTLGATATSLHVTEELVKVWLETPFEGGRHERRVKKIETR